VHTAHRPSKALLSRKRKSAGCQRPSPSSSEIPPATAIARQQFERAGWPLAAGRIELQSRSAGLLPRIKNGLHRLPAGFNTVGTLKKHVVANQAIIDQRLVASRRFSLEIVLVRNFICTPLVLTVGPGTWC
jgi:hypothetical protein